MDSGMQSAVTVAQQAAPGGAGDNGAAAPNPATAVVAAGDQAGPSTEVDRTKHPSGIVPVLQNLVATVNMGCQLELKTIALSARNAEYNPKVNRCSGDDTCVQISHNSVLRRSSCGSAIPRPPRSSLRRARWWSRVPRARSTAAWLHARCVCCVVCVVLCHTSVLQNSTRVC